ncbi:hypothetical protein P154DRAFT_522224 [Amniculicola lignicola CBS 123094]|uniref:Uncharacterized protein n=1 Tax=Amniculicola lignicola CBS 123094 TaxID=1392246 RepID=A0A6A5WH48_9PLEO|nr:hypothetical protein P154DRAFT_522224 [Amniculicola lignicola CBS 123094]
MSAPSPEPSQDLSYPPVRVNHSLARHDLSTLIMRSQPRRFPEEAQSALDESSYELLGDGELSDDEAHTESLASTDGPTPDDVSVISDEDEDEDEDEFDEHYVDDASQYLPHTPAEPSAGPFHDHPAQSPAESMLTSKAETQLGEALYLDIEEIPSPMSGRLEARGIINEFDQQHGLPTVFVPYESPHIRLTVRLPLAERYLFISRPFKLLFIGDFPSWVEQEVTRHVGAALEAAPGSSRVRYVRGEIVDSSSTELSIDKCTAPEIRKQADGPPQVVAPLKDGTELIFGPRRAIRSGSGASLPDLVVFYHVTVQPMPESGAEAHRIRLIREALKRHNIPALDISTVRPFGKCPESFAFDASSLRLCVEGRHEPSHDFEILETLPMNIYDFQRIDPRQLNRHLACWIPSDTKHTGTRVEGPKGTAWSWVKNNLNIEKVFDPSVSWLSELPRFTFMFWVMTFLLSAASMWYLPTVNTPWVGLKDPSVPFLSSLSSVSSQTSTSTPVAWMPALCQSTPSSTVTTAIVASTPRELSVVPKEVKPSPKKQELPPPSKEEKYGGFEIKVTGENEFTLHPSKHFANKKRKPQLEIHVSRDFRPVPVSITRRSDGVYIVELEQDLPRSLFNVSIMSKPKPILQETFEVTLGSDKSFFARLTDETNQMTEAVRQQLATAQARLKKLSSQAMQSNLAHVDETVAALKEKMEERTQAIVDQVEKRKQAHLEHARKSFQAIQDDMWARSRPYRTDPNVLKARERALRLWDNIKSSSGTAKKARKPWQDSKQGKKPCGKKGKGLSFMWAGVPV